ncbi:MAG TPA: hypothetical protein VHV77_07625 [Pirellulales bacterium]|jgi:hypothetical protein|nr:hypothetical protein [Pirellulales bacterium]
MKRHIPLQFAAIAVVCLSCSLAEAGWWGPRYVAGYATPTVYYSSPYVTSYGAPQSSMGYAYSTPYYGVQGYGFAYPYTAGYSTYPPAYNAYYTPWNGYYNTPGGYTVGYGSPYLFNPYARYGVSYGMAW